MLNLNLSSRELRKAANIQDKIATLQSELGKILGTATPTEVVPAKKRKMSAAGRARIAAAARARWAKVNGAKKSVKPVKKARRKMSAAGRAKIAAAAKLRWKNAKAAGRTKL